MARAVIFFELDIFDIRFGISVPKDIKNGWCIHRIAEKKVVITTRPTISLSTAYDR